MINEVRYLFYSRYRAERFFLSAFLIILNSIISRDFIKYHSSEKLLRQFEGFEKISTQAKSLISVLSFKDF